MAPPSCIWCSAKAVAQLRLAIPWLRCLPAGYYPACGPHLISEGIRLRTAHGWPARVSVIPLPPLRPGAEGDDLDDVDACRIATALINDGDPDDRFPMNFDIPNTPDP